MATTVAETRETPGPIVGAGTVPFMRATQVAIVAERLLQARSNASTASLNDVGRATRQRYEDAAAVALALVDDDGSDTAAIYAGAQRVLDLGAQTPTQRRELVTLAQQIVDRYIAVLAGHHQAEVARLQRFIDIDSIALQEGGL